MATKQDAINAVIQIANAEVGYLEKKSNSQLDSKTANAGSANFTKYWRDVDPAFQAQPWCAAFVTWVFDRVFGKSVTKKLLKHYPYTYCPKLGDLFTKYANPQVGDIVIFKRNGVFAHTGIVTMVFGDWFETIEGNTSGASGIIANGGGVCKKSYYNSNLPGTKFCRVDWAYAAKQLQAPKPETPRPETSKPETSGKGLNTAPKWVGKVTASSLSVRSWAGTEYPEIKSWPKLARGNLIDVCDTVKAADGSQWYYIRIAGKYYGFSSAKYIVRA